MTLLVVLAMAASTFSAPLTLPKVAKVEMSVERSREDVRNGEMKSASAFTRYEKTIEARDGGYRVTLKPVETRLPELPSETDQAKLQAAVENLTNHTFVYAADESLAPKSMEGWSSIIAEIRKTLTALVGDSPEGQQALGAVVPVFERMNPQQAAAVLLKEDGFLTIPVNVDLEAGKPHTYEDRLPNPLGGPPIKADGVIALETIDTARNVAVVRWTLTLNAQSAKDSMAVALEALAARMPQKPGAPDPRTALASLKLDRTSGCLYEIDLKTGLPLKANCESLITSSDPSGQTATRTERWVITQSLKT